MKTNERVQMGKMDEQWKGGLAKTITFSVTESCNLACKYCYMTGKNTNNKMSFETAKDVVDYVLTNRELFNEEAVIWEFIGGEPLLEIDLIDKISDYIKIQMYKLDHPWFCGYMFNMSTNGLLYDTTKVQNYIKKNKGHVSIGISVDGNKIKHDLQRVKLDGSGSYDDVMKNVPLWLKQFPNGSTKATFAHDDLIHIKDSIISLWENGMNIVSANVVFEDVWHEGDDIIYENQLKELGDYILENQLWEDYSVRFFEPHLGFPLSEEDKKRNYCGAGKMLAVDYKGNYFPCVRFLDFTLNNKQGMRIGHVNKGINTDKIRPFLALSLEAQSKEECLNCEVASGCSWCTGFNYDAADTDTIYQRATFICKMHKANVRANKYFWDKFQKVTGIESLRESHKKGISQKDDMYTSKFIQFIMSDNITPHCSYRNTRDTQNNMSEEVFKKGLKFSEENGFTPLFLGGDVNQNEGFSIVDSRSALISENSVVICDNNYIIPENLSNVVILLVSKENVSQVMNFVDKIYLASQRINIILENIEAWTNKEFEIYTNQLELLVHFIVGTYKKGAALEVNVLTDLFNLKSMCNCDAGKSTFALAPNGKIYLCPAFYFDDPEDYVGDLENGLNLKNKHLLNLENAPICSSCDAYHCRRCKYLNNKLTGEINTPSRTQCIITHIERNKSRELQEILLKEKLTECINKIQEVEYMDPLEKIVD
ncbi:radical SAM peptide maturase, CXXX-repeat target family [Clostridium botulinum]|uniref:radical SAM peptide maturase, CXXX-repeat target family n=1 Tax=Clostridium botulinum TaxID=1491 RepID=UPI0007730D61|nr:radical SAM peptide maturase, CXXX-repeat target family [Clostridium botulinum]AUN02485.1 radical SAM protein [Clostridium botulinum]MBN3397834.1 radical SAM protein [Clostridium botulinum]MBN3411761.1 radical SAM protein [Clostridium botulinum]